jgi:hypothetical protein
MFIDNAHLLSPARKQTLNKIKKIKEKEEKTPPLFQPAGPLLCGKSYAMMFALHGRLVLFTVS